MTPEERRARIRERTLAQDGLAEGDLYDHKRPTRFSAVKNRRREQGVVQSAEDEWFDPEESDETWPIWLGCLSFRQKQVMIRRLSLGPYPFMTQQEIANELGISRQTVGEYEAAALEKMADHLLESPPQARAAF